MPQAQITTDAPEQPISHARPDVWEMPPELVQALPGGDWFGPAVDIAIVGEWMPGRWLGKAGWIEDVDGDGDLGGIQDSESVIL